MQLETVGEIVRILRSRLDLEQVQLARACGWRDASAVSRIETDRIRPTRRTLTKLADALAKESVTGTSQEVRAWLYRAAGILPTADEVRALEAALPRIDDWGQPAIIMDFGWYVWHANPLAVRLMGLPRTFRGRNYLELMFEGNSSIREKLGGRWDNAARVTLMDFRSLTDRQSDRRWHKKLITKLLDLPDFQRLWAESAAADRGAVYQRLSTSTVEGTVAMLHLTLTADPRLILTHVVPEDAQMTRVMVQRGMMLA